MNRTIFGWAWIGWWVLAALGSRATEAASPMPLVKVSWQERHAAKMLQSGDFIPAVGQEPDHLRLQQTTAEPRLFTLVEIPSPPIDAESYVVRGRLRYQGVTGESYLEMWNHFPGGAAYFTKTLGASGPLGRLTGSSDWREFQLPFHKGKEPAPEKLVISLQLQGEGSVDITDLELIAPFDGIFGESVADAWWSDATGGLIGGIAGSFLGVFLGGVIGPLAGLGRARGFVTATLWVVGLGSCATLTAGVVAVCSGQPFGVHYPLLLLGGLGAFFGFGGLPLCQQRYRAAEFRRMSALDASS